MSDISGSRELIKIDIQFAVKQMQTSLRQIEKLEKSLKKIQKQTAAAPLKSGIDTSIKNTTKSLKDLEVQARRSRQEIKSIGNATVGLQKISKDAAKARLQMRAYREEQKLLGYAIRGQPKSFGHLAQNIGRLRDNLKDTGKAGILAKNQMRSFEDGVARAGGRGFTAFERLRIQSFSLRRGLFSVGQEMVNIGKRGVWAGSTITRSLTVPLAGFATAAVYEFNKVQKQMFQLQKVTEFQGMPANGGGLGEFYSGLRTEIVRISEDLGQSQAVITGVFRDIAALGFSTPEIITEWSEAIAQLAAVGDIDLSVATEFFRVTNALFADTSNIVDPITKARKEITTLQGRFERTQEIMAQFNAIADETSLQLKDLADAFPEVAPVMQNMGFEASEIAASLAGMYKRGIPATEAAHALKFGFQRLVGPTKDATKTIQDLGISFFDSSGNISGAQASLVQMSAALLNLNNEAQGKAFGDLVGNRQVARWLSYAKDVVLGEMELQRAMKNGFLDREEVDEITSDYMRGLIAANTLVESGRLRKDQVRGINDPISRYQQAIKRFKEDPTTQFQKMVTTFKNALINVGAIIVPVITEWGQKIANITKKLSELPAPVLRLAAALLVVGGILGPMIILFNSIKVLQGFSAMAASFAVPKAGVKDIMKRDASGLFKKSPGRTDIARFGDSTFQLRGGDRDVTPGGAAAQKADKAAKAADKQVKNLDKSLRKTAKGVQNSSAIMSSATTASSVQMTKGYQTTGTAATAWMSKATVASEAAVAANAQVVASEEAVIAAKAARVQSEKAAAVAVQAWGNNMVAGSKKVAAAQAAVNNARLMQKAPLFVDKRVARAGTNLFRGKEAAAASSRQAFSQRTDARREETMAKRAVSAAGKNADKKNKAISKANDRMKTALAKHAKFEETYQNRLKALNAKALIDQKALNEAKIAEQAAYESRLRALQLSSAKRFGGDAVTVARRTADLQAASAAAAAASTRVAKSDDAVKSLKERRKLLRSNASLATREFNASKRTAERAIADIGKAEGARKTATAKRVAAEENFNRVQKRNLLKVAALERKLQDANAATRSARAATVHRLETRLAAAKAAMISSTPAMGAAVTGVTTARGVEAAAVSSAGAAQAKLAASITSLEAIRREGELLAAQMAKQGARDATRHAAAARVFGVQGGRKAGIISGMTYGRWWSVGAEGELIKRSGRIKALMMGIILFPRTAFRAGAGLFRDLTAVSIMSFTTITSGFRSIAGQQKSLAVQSAILRKKETAATLAHWQLQRKMGRIAPAAFYSGAMKKDKSSAATALLMLRLKTLAGAAFGAVKIGAIGATVALVKFIAIIAVIGVVLGGIGVALYAFIKTIVVNWDKVRDAIQPTIDLLSQGWDKIKAALESISNTFKNTIMKTLFGPEMTNSDGPAKKAGMSWEFAADIINTAFDWIARGMETVAELIEKTGPLWTWLGQLIGSTIGFVASLIKTDFSGAMWFLVDVVFQVIKPLLYGLEAIQIAFSGALKRVLQIVAVGAKATVSAFMLVPNGILFAVNAVREIFGQSPIDNTIQAFFNKTVDAYEEWAGKLLSTKWVDSLQEMIDKNKPKFDWNNQFDEVDAPTPEEEDPGSLGEGLGEDAQDAGEDIAEAMAEGMKNALAEFINKLKENLSEKLSELRKSMEDSLKKAHEARLKKFDDEIKAIDDTIKKEQELLEIQQYVEKKKEMLAKRSLDLQNYQRNRALAIYENRINDVRDLDAEQKISSKDHNKSLFDLENDRAKDLIDKQREIQKQSIEDAKKAEEERLTVLEESFKKQLDLFLKYTPKNVAAYNSMLNDLKNLTKQFGAEWPEGIQTGQQAFADALKQTNEDIRKEFEFSAENPFMAWVAQFVDTDVAGILAQKISEAGAAGSGGETAPGAGPVDMENVKKLTDDAIADLQGYQYDTDIKGPDLDTASWERTSLNIKKWWDDNWNWAIFLAGGPGSALLAFITDQLIDFLSDIDWGAVWDTVKQPFIDGWNSVFEAVRSFMDPIVGWIQEKFESVKEFLRPIWEGIGNTIATVFEKITNIWNNTWAVGESIFNAISDIINNVLIPVFNFVKQIVVTAFEIIGEIISWAWNTIISPIFQFIANMISSIVVPAFDFLRDIVTTVWNLIWTAIEFAVNQIAWVWNNILNPAIQVVLGFFEKLSEGVKVAWDKIGEIIGAVTGWIKEKLEDGTEFLANWRDNFKKVFENIKLAVAIIWTGFVNFIINGINGIIEGFEKFINAFDFIATALGKPDLFPEIEIGFRLTPLGDPVEEFVRQKIEAARQEFEAEKMAQAYARNEAQSQSLREQMMALANSAPQFHVGGIVGKSASKFNGKLARDEVLAVLQKGEGVLPKSAMAKLGPQVFEALRQGALGNVVTGAIAGGMYGSMSAAPVAQQASGGHGGDIYINVDTFVGQEEWFNELASQYDMKVSARKAKVNGSQKRVISSYNSNERNTYR
jgi:TP901 family phage tail tape measure protein